MSDDDEFNERLRYAPPWARQAAARTPAEPRDDHPVDLDQHRRRVNPYDGDVALREMRERLALDPDALPAPPRPTPTARPWRTAVRVVGVSIIVAASSVGAYLLASTFLTPSSSMAPASNGTAPTADIRPPVKSDRQVVTALSADATAPRVVAPVEPPPPLAVVPPATPVTAPVAPPPVAVAPRPTAALPPSTAPAPVQVAPEPVVAAPPVQPLDPEEVASLIARGRSFITNGDIAAARLVLRRAADAGDATAALLLGSTFDPATLRPLKVIGTTPDVAQAGKWYRRAAELGSVEASRRLDELSGGR